MAEAEQAHRIATESEGSRATIAEARRGQFVGAAVSIIALGGAVFTAYIGAHWEVSVAFLSLPILGIVRVLVRPRRER